MSAEKTQANSGNVSLETYFEEAKALLNFQLRSLAPIISELKLQRQINYTLQTDGKRLRYAMVLLSGECVGGNRETLRNLALAIELLHSATLVHDDILDQDLFRRNSPSVQARWSVKEAILVGDALASLALKLCQGYRGEVLTVMAETCLQLSDGEYMDIEESSLSEADYFEKIRKKTASLFRAATQCGALVGKATSEVEEALAGFGENYGCAFQIRDDVADSTFSADKSQSDLEELLTTLPLIHLRENAPEKVDRLISSFSSKYGESAPFAKRDLLSKLKVCLEEAGSLEYCARKIDTYVDTAISGLAPLEESVRKGLLVEMAEALRLRPGA
jgi:geranylgeranyl pyrophosphate synthase